MRKAYRHLRAHDRGVIYRMNKEGKTQKEIAAAIGFGQSSVSKELNRNKGLKGYRPKQAEELSQVRKSSKRTRPQIIIGKLRLEIEHRLSLKHSPEQISGALALEGKLVSHETLYKYIWEDKLGGGSLHLNLRINGKRRYRRRNTKNRTKIADRVGIEERPKCVEKRHRHGDWEADLVEGTKGSGFILSLYERKTRFVRIMKLDTKTAEETAQGIIEALKGFKVRTVTYDNGLEFSKHQQVNAALGSKSYFCQPYSSWEKGGVENFNGLLRQYYPKGSSFSHITPADLHRVEREINERPRKVLGYQSPLNKANHLVA